MPILKSAKKKLRKDKKRTKLNLILKKSYRASIKKVNKDSKTAVKDLQRAYSQIDKAAKKGIMHKNKARRLKSRLATRIKS